MKTSGGEHGRQREQHVQMPQGNGLLGNNSAAGAVGNEGPLFSPIGTHCTCSFLVRTPRPPFTPVKVRTPQMSIQCVGVHTGPGRLSGSVPMALCPHTADSPRSLGACWLTVPSGDLLWHGGWTGEGHSGALSRQHKPRSLLLLLLSRVSCPQFLGITAGESLPKHRAGHTPNPVKSPYVGNFPRHLPSPATPNPSFPP